MRVYVCPAQRQRKTNRQRKRVARDRNRASATKTRGEIITAHTEADCFGCNRGEAGRACEFFFLGYVRVCVCNFTCYLYSTGAFATSVAVNNKR